jgi:glycosyltransferase involved in cell wall biosynthesis
MYSTYFPPQYSGAAKQALSLAKELRVLGHHVEFATVQWPGTAARETVEGFTVHRLEQGRRERHRELRLWWNLLRLAVSRRTEFDIIHSHGAYYTNSIVGPLGRLAGWGSLVKASLAENDLHGIDRSLSGRIHGVFLRTIDACIAISRDLVEEFRGAGVMESRIHFMPNGVDTNRFRPAGPGERDALRRELGLPTDRPVALAPGVLDERKNIGWLMAAWVERETFGSGALLVAMGPQSREDVDGSHIASLRRLAAAQPRLVRLDDYSPDIEKYYQACDFLILPSHSEGLPNVVLEAMASGIPCVATRVSGSKELVVDGETGYNFAPGDAAELGRAVVKTLSEQEFLGATARKRMVEDFSLAILAARYEQLYRRLAGMS